MSEGLPGVQSSNPDMRGLGFTFTFGCQASTAAANGPPSHDLNSCPPLAFLPAANPRRAPTYTKPSLKPFVPPWRLCALHQCASSKPLQRRATQGWGHALFRPPSPSPSDEAAVCSAHVLLDLIGHDSD